MAPSIGNATHCIRRVDRRSPVAPLRHFAGDLLEGVAGIDELGTSTEVSKKNGPGIGALRPFMMLRLLIQLLRCGAPNEMHD